MSDDDARRRHPAGDDTFDDLFPARAGHPDDGRERARRPLRSSPDDPTQAVPAGRAARRTESVRRPQAPAAEVGSPPPPRGAGLLLPWIIITASVLAIGIVGFMVLRGQRTHPNTAATTPAVTRTVTQTQTPTATASTSSSVRTPATTSSASTPPAASTPPPGFTKCAGTDTGYKVSGSGTTCSFVADVAQKATAAVGSAVNGSFTVQADSTTTNKSYTLTCIVAAYLQCTIPPDATKRSSTSIYVMRG